MPPSSPKKHLKEPPVRNVRNVRMNAALAAFGIMVVLGPLAFGAVDRVVQVALVLVMAIGMFLQPPALLSLGRRGNAVVIALIGVLVLKEFLPWQWFGGARWRLEAQTMPGLDVAGTHHPEPARAFDALLVALLALVWLQWVRTMAARRETRVAMAWILFGAGVVFAGVCFLMSGKGAQASAIYGLRYTPGWGGWGPFPNRNHTASLLAMSALAGLGCTVWAGARGRRRLTVLATFAVLVVLVALLMTKSRGGLVGLAVGLAVFGGMMLWRHRSRRTLAIVLGGMAIIAVVVVMFGSQVIGRFAAAGGKLDSSQLRKDVWSNAVTMWRDAPLLGHGVQTFGGLFPFYQRLTLDDNVVLHPESSWLQWLCELGLVPTVILAGLVGRLVGSRFGDIFKRRGTFYLSTGALSGLAALAAHSVIDVPGHRWGTAGYALALLALACPISREVQIIGAVAPRTALAPLTIGVYWALPFFGFGPAWQPVRVEQLRAREAAGVLPRTTPDGWKTALRYFPLQPELHHLAALRELETGVPKTSEWQRHIEIVHRLVPGSWGYPIVHARVVKRLSPALCVHYWQVAIGRSGWRASGIFREALNDTASLPVADSIWPDYIAAHPALALAYARTLPEADTRPFFDLWWNSRARATDLTADELRDFYTFARRWATGEQVLEWMRLHASHRREDFRAWIALLHGTGMSDRAWKLYQGRVEEPGYPASAKVVSREEIEARVRIAPENLSNLVELARVSEQAGDRTGARKIIMEVAARKDAPSWFLRKAACFLAEDGKFPEAVEMIIREN
jgi:O-antigen ligase